MAANNNLGDYLGALFTKIKTIKGTSWTGSVKVQDFPNYIHVPQSSKTVTPTKAQQTIKADAGYDCLTQVVVNAAPTAFMGYYPEMWHGAMLCKRGALTANTTSNIYIGSASSTTAVRSWYRADETNAPTNGTQDIYTFASVNATGSYRFAPCAVFPSNAKTGRLFIYGFRAMTLTMINTLGTASPYYPRTNANVAISIPAETWTWVDVSKYLTSTYAFSTSNKNTSYFGGNSDNFKGKYIFCLYSPNASSTNIGTLCGEYTV